LRWRGLVQALGVPAIGRAQPMYAVFIGVGVLVLASLSRWSAGKVRKKYSCFFFLEFFSGGFALIDTDMWLIVRNRWNFNEFETFWLPRHAVFALIA
jgi:hypothetical protein